MDAIDRRQHLADIRCLPVHRAERNFGQEVEVTVFEERPHTTSPTLPPRR
jgi:hypothetical protein